jgi:Fur family ferric uptake transcriptional regulator
MLASMNPALLLFEKILRTNSLSITNARKKVFLALLGNEPQSMRDIERSINKSINRTSIYRVIELFDKLGLIHKVQIGWKYKIELSDVFVGHHHHISCLGCGKVIAIHEDKSIERLIHELAATHNIQRPVHQLEIQGYCEGCVATL